MIDWQFELEKAHEIAESKEIREIVELREGDILQSLAYVTVEGENLSYGVPASLYGENGFARMIIDGLPVELTLLLDNRVEMCWPVGMHDHV